MRVWEAVARIDASVAWNLVMDYGIANYAAWLPKRSGPAKFVLLLAER